MSLSKPPWTKPWKKQKNQSGNRGARNTRVYLSGDNLLLFTPYTGYDPEVFVARGLASRGIDYLTYPRARTFTAGARVQF